MNIVSVSPLAKTFGAAQPSKKFIYPSVIYFLRDGKKFELFFYLSHF